VYLVSGGTAFPFRLSCSFFLNIQSLPFPFLVIFCFFLGLFLSEMQTCILKVAYIIIISDLKNSNWKEKDTMLQTAQLKLEKKKKQDKATHRLIFFTTFIFRAAFSIFTFPPRNSSAYRWCSTSKHEVFFSTLGTVTKKLFSQWMVKLWRGIWNRRIIISKILLLASFDLKEITYQKVNLIDKERTGWIYLHNKTKN